MHDSVSGHEVSAIRSSCKVMMSLRGCRRKPGHVRGSNRLSRARRPAATRGRGREMRHGAGPGGGAKFHVKAHGVTGAAFAGAPACGVPCRCTRDIFAMRAAALRRARFAHAGGCKRAKAGGCPREDRPTGAVCMPTAGGHDPLHHHGGAWAAFDDGQGLAHGTRCPLRAGSPDDRSRVGAWRARHRYSAPFRIDGKISGLQTTVPSLRRTKTAAGSGATSGCGLACGTQRFGDLSRARENTG